VKVTTYSELYDYFKAYDSGDFSFLLIEARGGVGKSYHAQHVLTDSHTTYFQGHVTPYSLFLTTSNNNTDNLLFDDVDTLLDNPTNIQLLKQICDTTDTKMVKWQTTRGGKEDNKSFTSKNNALILTNRIQDGNKHLQALKTRAVHLRFEPTNQQVLTELGKFFDDKDILDYIQNQDLPKATLNFRVAVKAKQIKQAGLDWKRYVDETLNKYAPEPHLVAQELYERAENDEDFTKGDAVEAYKTRTGRSRKSFYNDVNK